MRIYFHLLGLVISYLILPIQQFTAFRGTRFNSVVRPLRGFSLSLFGFIFLQGCHLQPHTGEPPWKGLQQAQVCLLPTWGQLLSCQGVELSTDLDFFEHYRICMQKRASALGLPAYQSSILQCIVSALNAGMGCQICRSPFLTRRLAGDDFDWGRGCRLGCWFVHY